MRIYLIMRDTSDNEDPHYQMDQLIMRDRSDNGDAFDSEEPFDNER
jgi:hypothetical protein